MRPMTIAIFAGALILAIPAFAQMPSIPSNPGSMSGLGGMAKSAMPSDCQGMIDQASSMVGALQGAKKTSALSQISQAQSALSAGNPSACMSHVNKVMGMLK